MARAGLFAVQPKAAPVDPAPSHVLRAVEAAAFASLCRALRHHHPEASVRRRAARGGVDTGTRRHARTEPAISGLSGEPEIAPGHRRFLCRRGYGGRIRVVAPGRWKIARSPVTRGYHE